jgi:hypothetical protein
MWCLALLLTSACEPSGSSNAPGDGKGGKGGKGGQASAQSCASDPSLGEQLVADYRTGRAAGGELAAARASLRESCEAGCAAACLEHAHTSATRSESAESWRHACEAGGEIGCSYAKPPDGATATQLCERGELLGCATALLLDPDRAADPANWQPLTNAARTGCEANDGRACSVQAWLACSLAETCDADAITLAERAARLLPNPEIIEGLAIVQCRAGQAEAANSTLADSCTAGNTDACARTCETLRGQAVLVRADASARMQTISLYLALNLDMQPNWYTVASAMDATQLDSFEQMLAKFLPPVTEAGQKAKVPAGLREQAPELVEAILRSPQVDAKKIAYWFKRLPDMPEDQRVNLLESLRKQWWIIPGDPGQTPQSYVDTVRLRSGGLSPSWVVE